MARDLRTFRGALAFLAVVVTAGAASPGGAQPRCAADDLEGSAKSTQTQTTPTFTPYRVPSTLSTRANRDLEFLWSSTYPDLFAISGAALQGELDQYGITICETYQNAFGFPMTDIQLVHDYLGQRVSYRDSTYSPTGPIGFRVKQPSYPDADRSHIDTYVYAPKYGSFPGDDPSNYGRFPAYTAFDYSQEDVSTGNPPGTGSYRRNSISLTGPTPPQVGVGGAGAWWRADGPSNSTWDHEFQHALNNDNATAMSEMFGSIAQSIGGTPIEPNPYDVPFTSSLLRQDGLNPSVNNYYAWESFGAYVAFNFRGTDTTFAGRSDDLLWRWVSNGVTGAQPGLTELGHRLQSGQCAECNTKSYLSTLSTIDRREVLLHNWRVSSFVENPALAEGQYGIPGNFGPPPSRKLGFWRNNDGLCSDDVVAVPPETTLTSAQIGMPLTLSGTRSITCPGTGVSSYPMTLDEYGSEVWVLRAGSSLNLSGNTLVVRVSPTNLPPCSANRLMATLIGYTQSDSAGIRMPLWSKPAWAQSTSGTRWVDVTNLANSIELTLPGYGTTYKAAVLVLTLGSSGALAAGQAQQVLNYRLDLSVATGTFCTLPAPTLEVASATVSDERAAFSPETNEIAYTHYTPGMGDGRIYRKTLGGGAGVPLTSGTPAGPQATPHWSPRGDKIVFEQDTPGGDTHVWVHDLPSNTTTQLTTSTRWEAFPAFSPNGQQIAYSRGVGYGSSVWEIRKMNVDGSSNSVVYACATLALLQPRWSPDGSRIYFLRNDSLFAVPSSGATVPVHVPKVGAGLLSYDLPLGNANWPLQQGIAKVCPSGSTQYFALQDTVTLARTYPYDQAGKRTGQPRMAYDGIRVAFGMGTAGGSDLDLYVASTTCNQAPAFNAASKADVVIPLCVQYERYLGATDPNGDPITYQASYLPPGATFSGNRFRWTPSSDQGLMTFFVVFRALDNKGGLDHQVVKISTTDECEFVCPPGHYCYPESSPGEIVDAGGLPSVFALGQNSPNPFREATSIRFDLPRPAPVSLSIYDVAGRRVRMLVDKDYEAGRWSVEWDRRDEAGKRAPLGVYFYRARIGSFVDEKKLLILP